MISHLFYFIFLFFYFFYNELKKIIKKEEKERKKNKSIFFFLWMKVFHYENSIEENTNKGKIYIVCIKSPCYRRTLGVSRVTRNTLFGRKISIIAIIGKDQI